MRPFRFLHTADLHLGTPFQGLGKSVPDTWLQRLRVASYQSFARIVDIAIHEQVQFVTIAGDLFDAANVPMAVQFELHRGFERLQRHHIQAFICHGNHDPLQSPRPLQWPTNVHVFAAIPQLLPDNYVAPSVVHQPVEGTTVQVSGFSYGKSELHQSRAECFVRDAGVDFAIALYHGVVGSPGSHANYGATRLQTIAQRDFDFWGLGHIHKPGVLQAERPTVIYPGNPQGRHIREDGARGVVIVDVEEKGRVSLRNVSTATIQWQRLSVDVDGVEYLDEVRDRIFHSMRDLRSAAKGTDFICRLTLIGNTSLHGHLTDSVEFLESIQGDIEYQRFPVLVERIDVRTSPLVDVETLRHSEAFIGEFLRLVKDYRNHGAVARERLLPVLADVFHLGNDLSLQDMTDADMGDLLDDVVRLVLKQLVVEEVTG